MKNALVVIDMQKGFMNENTKHIIPKIESLIKKNLFDYVLFTQFINTNGSQYEKLLQWSELKNSPQIDIVDELEKYSGNLFKKNYYTSCTEEFVGFLEKNDIKELYFAGVDTNICVTKTSVDIFEKGYIPYILSDYCASHTGPEYHKFALKNLEKFIGEKSIIKGEVYNL
tara:strand:- start:448 stop:957 length:510 start_codon:yes stop_codon:yes gene_type:complete